MMELTLELREESGLQWVLERLSPMSPFGRAAARALRWYAPGEEAALETELDNVALALEFWNAAGTLSPEPESCCCGAPRLDPASLKDMAAILRGVTRCLPLFHDIRGSLDRDPENPFDLVELFEIKHFLVTLEQLTVAYAKLPSFQDLTFVPMDESLNLLDPDGRRLPAFSVSETYHPDLGPLRAEKAALERSIRAANEEEKAALLDQRHRLTVQEDLLELEVRRTLTRRLMDRKADFLANMEALGRMDLFLAKAKLAKRYRCVRPVLSGGSALSLQGLRHPQVAEELASRGEDFTPLDLNLAAGCTVITGANMGGKTVSLRSTVLSLLLCQCGFFVFANSASLPLFHEAALILADTGPGSGGLSSFGREVHLLDRLLDRTRGQRFFLALDEFARGTNPQEGAALAQALVQYLGTLDCVALMTTHYDGVSDVAGAHYQVAGLVREIHGDEGDDPRSRIARRMDYRLMSAPPGAPCPRDALRVCRLLDLEPALMELFQADL
ncbi:DNA mismatch repair protein MutS [uncultured Oscillibacter sp.]|uniref:lysine 5,6-aminomutase reactivase ATPase KamC n=1 Tax=uncultured Oscillibacter sp. TaxID=876091 RepID=UPI002626E465|nr:DNA mismatch repair protein MutS [uncultured Oscillibacter sp.]